VPSLSWRDAAYHLLATNASGFLFDEVYLDHGHPNGECGHRCGHALAAKANIDYRVLGRTGASHCLASLFGHKFAAQQRLRSRLMSTDVDTFAVMSISSLVLRAQVSGRYDHRRASERGDRDAAVW